MPPLVQSLNKIWKAEKQLIVLNDPQGVLMNVPATVSHYVLLNELVRRIESGWEPDNENDFCDLYLDLTDAWLRSEQLYFCENEDN